MSQDTVKTGMQEVQEIILGRGKYPMSVPANTQQQLESRAHGIRNKTPFYDYKISNDGGVTFWPPSQFQTIDSLIYVDMFVDDTNIYFSYHYSSGAPANAALSLVFQYKLYVTEATK